MNIRQFNGADEATALALLGQCCASRRWAARVLAERPFANPGALLACAERCWRGLDEKDYLEAFAAHPKIGELSSLHEKYADTLERAAGEQRAVTQAAPQAIKDLAAYNRVYEQRFGFIFIVCASGRSAAEMLAMLRARLANPRHAELGNAAGEQGKITRLRLGALFDGAPPDDAVPDNAAPKNESP